MYPSNNPTIPPVLTDEQWIAKKVAQRFTRTVQALEGIKAEDIERVIDTL
jgi:hypothetical protein